MSFGKFLPNGVNELSNILVGSEILDFLLFDWLKIADRVSVERITAGAILEMATKLASTEFLRCYKDSDRQEPHLDEGGVHILPAVSDALRQYADLGLFGMSFPEDMGGMGLPQSLSLAINSIFASANISIHNYIMLTAANARLIVRFGTPAQIEAFAKPEIAGRWLGTMCLSEPQAGSSLGDVRTVGVPDGADALGARFRLFGTKMWISGGDQDATENIVHLVLAKIARKDGSLPDGTRGLSLFLVPKMLSFGVKNDVVVSGLNHKMGNRGTSNCVLNFGECDGAIGWLVGAEGQGLAQMFQMMNEARIAVGVGAAALAYRGYRHAIGYARERLQGWSAEANDGKLVPIIEHSDVKRMLLQQKAYSEAGIALGLLCGDLVDRADADSAALLGLLTPIAKSWASEFGAIANDLVIQVHGGYGYVRDFDVEQLWRDNRLNSIHEGTLGIQAIDLLGRKLLSSDGHALALLHERIFTTAQKAIADTRWCSKADALLDYWEQVESAIEELGSVGPGALDEATTFLRAFGHGVIAWLWLDMALASARAGIPGLDLNVRAACDHFFDAELPQASAWLSVVRRKNHTVRKFPSKMLM